MFDHVIWNYAPSKIVILEFLETMWATSPLVGQIVGHIKCGCSQGIELRSEAIDEALK
jgi:hypothetical protein